MKLRMKKQQYTVAVGDVTVTCEPLTARETKDIRRACRTVTGVGAEAVEDVDREEFACRVFCATVKAWDGAQDGDGFDIACTDEIKRLVWDHDQEFCEAVLRGLRDQIEADRRIVTKN